jgi:hypothetical protein
MVRRTSTQGSEDGGPAIRRRRNPRIGFIFGSFHEEPMERRLDEEPRF